MNLDDRIAIVGMAGRFSGSSSLDAFWANVISATDTSREVPPGRWIRPADELIDPRVGAFDRIYSPRGYYLDDIPEVADAHGLDPLFHLVLDVGRSAYETARLEAVDPSRIGVILGNIALPTDAISAFARDIFADPLGYPRSGVDPRNRFVAGLPAAMLAQSLGLGGPAFTLDAACASSLYALHLACDALRMQRVDAVLAGGCSRPDCLYTQMGFAQLRALSPTGRCTPFDARANGLVVGEGAGIFVLKRLRDAISAGDTIHGVIVAIGLSNDREGNLLAPASEGQLRAMRAAYRQAGWSPESVDLIECHATGTPVGDAVEFQSLCELRRGDSPGRCVIGSVKSTVGHLLTGASSAALAKVLGAFRERVLPPTANFERPADGITLPTSPFRILQQAEKWPAPSGHPRRAAISGFGFGGINAHALVEEWVGTIPERVTITVPNVPEEPLAIVGMATRFGQLSDLHAFQRHVLRGEPIQPEDTVLPTVELAADVFRIPPLEVAEMLPQQVVMLELADAALRDCQCRDHEGEVGVWVGVNLDPNTTNFHLRWSLDEADRDYAGPPLTANRTMGALASIAASRIARAFKVGGPCFTLSAEDLSGGVALQSAARALRTGMVDRAIVGAVDITNDPRSLAAAEYMGIHTPANPGAAVIVLRRLSDAERDGERIYAILHDVTVSRTSTPHHVPPHGISESGEIDHALGYTGAARVLAGICKLALALWQQMIPGPGARYWLIDHATETRRATLNLSAFDGGWAHAQLEEHVPSRNDDVPERRQPLGPPNEGLFIVRAETAHDLTAQLRTLQERIDGHTVIAGQATTWWSNTRSMTGRLAVALLASSASELHEQIAFAITHLNDRAAEPFRFTLNDRFRDRVFYSPAPLAEQGTVGFVFPGSGNHFTHMGRDLGAMFPAILRQQQAENDYLRSQYSLDAEWTPQALIFAQVALGTMSADLLASVGLRPTAVIGNSLGESASLFGMRVWTARDEMYHRIQRSTLFRTDLAGPCDAARRFWQLREDESVEWMAGIIPCPADEVRAALRPGEKAYLVIINTPNESVIAGHRPDVEAVIDRIGKPFVRVDGVTTAHCEVTLPIEEPYRALHTLPVTVPEGMRFYSTAAGDEYTLSSANCAEAILRAVQVTIDFPRIIERAYADGVRIFVEPGPGASCSRMIDAILGERPHLCRSLIVPRQDNVSLFLRMLGHLAAEGVTIDLSPIYPVPPIMKKPESRRLVTVPVGPQVRPLPPRFTSPAPAPVFSVPVPPPPSHVPVDAPMTIQPMLNGDGPHLPVSSYVETQVTVQEAHEAYLRFSAATMQNLQRIIEQQTQLLVHSTQNGVSLALPAAPVVESAGPAPALDTAACFEFAVGSIARVLGSEFAEVDTFPTRVRLPDGPLMLVDQIVSIEGEPRSMTSGRVITTHYVHADRWYLDAGRIPTCVAVEAGQADLFLSGYLGIDFQTRGLAVYRLLDAVVTFHGPLPGIGSTIRYDIHIDHFFRQGETYLFRFRFESTVDGRPLLSMRDGCAGFFSAEELAAGKGIVHTELDRRPQAGVRPADWQPLAPFTQVEALTAAQVDALRAGDLVGAFGHTFAQLPLSQPQRLPGGMLRLVDRVMKIDPHGGRFGLGMIQAEADIHPDDWFLTCHFVDDQVMPGTLMYECCLHTFRIFLMRLGWIGEEGQVATGPVPGVNSRLKCRGQVIASTKVVTYEVALKEIGYGPEPYAIADALMYADGKPIVEIVNLSIRLEGVSRAFIESLWQNRPIAPTKRVLYDTDRITAFAIGKPSEAFGDRYRIFDHDRIIARLPGPPFQFLDRIVDVTGEPWQMVAGPTVESEYDVPADAWYFAANRSPIMPFAVLLEIALQPCGWLAAYVGSALTSPTDLSFRNLGGKATQYEAIGPDCGTLTVAVKLTRVSNSGGMIIQHYDYSVRRAGRVVYDGNTYFGFFSKDALANQIGIRDAAWIEPSAEWPNKTDRVPTEFPFADAMLRMVDTISFYSESGGTRRLGFVQGQIDVDPGAWFFKAHFFQDPVWPGSLGLESFLQLLKYVAFQRWGTPAQGWQTVALNALHEWVYRGQVIPKDGRVTVQADITAIDDDRRLLTADGFLQVDGRVIYQMKGFTLQG